MSKTKRTKNLPLLLTHSIQSSISKTFILSLTQTTTFSPFFTVHSNKKFIKKFIIKNHHPEVPHQEASSTIMPVSLTQEEYYPPHLLAQKLNNRASYLITTGRYVEGIQLLTKALKLTEQDIRGTGTGGRDSRRTTAVKQETPCQCKACSFESCLVMEPDTFMSCIKEYQSHQEQEQEYMINKNTPSRPTRSTRSNGSSSYTHDDDNDNMDCDDNDQYHQYPSLSTPVTTTPVSHFPQVGSSTTTITTTEDCDDANAGTGFVYQRPLLVNKICMEELHDMGITLSLLILFNLALAHHLQSATARTPCSPKNLRLLQKALQLYELAYQLHVDYIQQQSQQQQDEDEDEDSTEEEDDDDAMKITHSDDSDDDNDSVINDHTQEMNHNNNTSTHTTDTSTNSNDYNRCVIGSLRFTMIVSNNLGEIHRVAGNTHKHIMCLQHLLSAIMYMVDSRVVVLDSEEMEGLYHNVTPIMLDDICAPAA